MAQQLMATQAARIGKWKGEILARAIPTEVLAMAGVTKQIPKNVSDTVVYRRWVPYNAGAGLPNVLIPSVSPTSTVETDVSNRVTTIITNNTLAEGTTPSVDSLVAQDITAVVIQLGCLYGFSDKVADLYEDDISDALKTQVADRITFVREMEIYSKVRASTNRFFGGTGTTLATVNGKLTAKLLRRAARSLFLNHAKKPTSILAPTPNIGTKAIEAAYLAFCSGDIEADLRDTTAFPTYTPVAAYGSRKPVHENEMGSFENFRFIASPELVAFQNGGVAIASSPNCVTTGGTVIDVYPIIVVSQESFGTIGLRGSKAFDLSVIPVGNKDSADPLGQRGYVGAKFYAVTTLLNQQWLAVLLVAAGDLI